MLISCGVNLQMTCAFFGPKAKCRFSHYTACVICFTIILSLVRRTCLHLCEQCREKSCFLHMYNHPAFKIRIFKPLVIFCRPLVSSCTAQFVSNLVRNPEDRFSCSAAHMRQITRKCILLHLESIDADQPAINLCSMHLFLDQVARL